MPVSCDVDSKDTTIESIKSVLFQSWDKWELVIVDDGSSYPVAQLLMDCGISDKRIRVLVHHNRLGITQALISGSNEARGEYIARLDADDVSMPERFAKQAARLAKEPQIVLVGTWYIVRYKNEPDRIYCPRDDDEHLRNRLLITNPFCHSSVMFRQAAYRKVGGYNAGYDTTQDLALWFELASIGRIGMVEEVLTIRNVGPRAISVGSKAGRQVLNGLRVRLRQSAVLNTGRTRPSIILLAALAAAYQYFCNVIRVR